MGIQGAISILAHELAEAPPSPFPSPLPLQRIHPNPYSLWPVLLLSLPGAVPRSCISYLMSAGGFDPPSGDMGIQGAISILAHELAEAASDPKGDAWWSDRTGDENCDKCQWNYK